MAYRRGLKWVGIASAWALVIGGGSFFAVRAHNQTELENAWSDFAVCLVGEELLGEEAPALRVRRIEIAIAEAKDRGERQRDEPWPNCSPYASRLQDAYFEVGDDRERRTSPQGLALQNLSIGIWRASSQESASKLQAVFDAFRDLPVKPRPELAPPVAPVKFALGEPSKVPAISFRVTVPPVATWVVKFREEREARAWFVPAPDNTPGAGGRIERAEFSTEITGKLSLAAGAGEALPLDALDLAGQGGVYDAKTGARTLHARGLLWGTWSDSAGRVAGIELVTTPAKVGDDRKPGWHLIANAPNESQSDVLLEGPKCSKSPEPRVVAGQVLWLCDGRDGRELYAAPLAQDLRSQGQLTRIGKLPFYPLLGLERIEACLTPRALFIDVRDSLPDRVLLSLRDGVWSLETLANSGSLSCHGETAEYTALGISEPKLSIARTRCEKAGCKDASVEFESPGASGSALRDGSLAVSTVGDKLALLVPDSAGALTLRVGALEELAKSPSAVLLDINRMAEGAKAFWGARWLPAQDSAVLILSTVQGGYVLRVLPDGTIRELTWDAKP